MAHPQNQRLESDLSFSREFSNPQISPNDLLNPFGDDYADPRVSSSNKPKAQNASSDPFSQVQRSANLNPSAHINLQEPGQLADYDPELNHILQEIGRSRQKQNSRNEPKSRYNDPMGVKNSEYKKSNPGMNFDYEMFQGMEQQPIGRAANRKGTADFATSQQIFQSQQPQSQANQPLDWNPAKSEFVGSDGLSYSSKGHEQMFSDTPNVGGYNSVKNVRQERYLQDANQIEMPQRLQSLEPLRPSMAKLLPKDAIGEYERLEKKYCASPYPGFNVFVTLLINISCIVVLCSVKRIELSEGKLCFVLSCIQINTEAGLYRYGIVTMMLFSQYLCFVGSMSYKNRNPHGLYWLLAVYVILVLCAMIRGTHELTVLFGILSFSLGREVRRLYYMEQIKVLLADRASELEQGEARRKIAFGDDDWQVYNFFWPNKVSKLCQNECLWAGILDILLVGGVFFVFYLIHLMIR